MLSRHFSQIRLFITVRTIAQHAPLSMGFLQARMLEWVACSPPGNLPDPGIEPTSLKSPALAGRFLITSAAWEAPVSFHLDSIPAVFLGSRYFHPASSSSPGHSEGAQCLWQGQGKTDSQDGRENTDRKYFSRTFIEYSQWGTRCFLNIYMILLNPHKNISCKVISIDHIARSGRPGTGIQIYWTPKSTPFPRQHPTFLVALDKKLRITWGAC